MRFATISLAVALGLAACGPADNPQSQAPAAAEATPPIYQERIDTGPNGEPLRIPAIKPAYLTERNQRQRVAYYGSEAPGTIVVDPYARVLYDVMEGGEAMRFGIAVGKEGTGFAGEANIKRKAKWPSWTPTANMVATQPELYEPVKAGLPGGLENPLGSRALYLYQGGRDTMYRIHGTMDPSSIGKATSAGCIRLFNQDIMDLFDETPLGTRVKVRTPAESAQMEGPLTETPDGYLLPAGPTPQPGTGQVSAAAPAPVAPAAPVRVAAAPAATAPAAVAQASPAPVTVTPLAAAQTSPAAVPVEPVAIAPTYVAPLPVAPVAPVAAAPMVSPVESAVSPRRGIVPAFRPSVIAVDGTSPVESAVKPRF